MCGWCFPLLYSTGGSEAPVASATLLSFVFFVGARACPGRRKREAEIQKPEYFE